MVASSPFVRLFANDVDSSSCFIVILQSASFVCRKLRAKISKDARWSKTHILANETLKKKQSINWP